MLVLTRRKHEQIFITVGDIEIVVRVIEVREDRVRIGVTAPLEVAIHREEVAARIKADKAIAASG